MEDVNISKYRASVVRDGSKPASPGFVVSEGQDPVNPPGTNNYVPYSGATANVELGEYGVEAGFITLDTTPTNTPADQGTIFWDADDETVDIILNGYTMKIGEDLFYPVKNQTGSTIAKGTAVRFNGTVGNSGRLLIAPFIANGSVPSNRFMGVTAEEILNGEDGKVLYFGRIRGINTNAFNEGDILYASTTVAGDFQTAIPVAPNNIVLVAAVVTKSINQGTIFVRPTLASNLNTDEAVKITSVANLDLLQYQSGTGLWENKTLAQVIGSAYVPSTRTITINGTTQDLSANRTYNVGTVTSVGLSSATSGVTIGSTPVTTSGTITLAIATASGSQNGLLSSTDWTTFNNKQNALTNPVTGTGTTNYLPKFTGSTTIGNSQIFDNGTSVGINNSNPNAGYQLDVTGYIRATGYGVFSNSLNVGFLLRHSDWTGVPGSNNLAIASNQGNLTFFTNGSATERMQLTAGGNLLVGTTSDTGERLQVNGSGLFSSTVKINTSGVNTSLNAVSSGLQLVVDGSTGSNRNITFNIASTEAMRIDNNLNLGLGVTPSAWSVLTAIQIKGGAFISGYNNNTYVGANWYFDGSVGRYLNNDFATSYIQTDGEHQWLTATSGTAGNAISFTQAMTLNASGNLLVGTTSDNGARLQVSGALTASSTTLTASANTYAGGSLKLTSFTGGTNIFLTSVSGLFALSNGGGADHLLIASTGAATFSSSVTAGTLSSRYHTMPSGAGFNAFEMGNDPTAGGWYIYDLTTSSYRLTIKNGGNVLIGTTTDNGARLQVSGGITALNSLVVTSSSNAALIASTNSTTGFSYLDFINSGASGRNYQIGVAGNGASSGYANNLYFDLVGVGNIMTLTSGRNVGIGTSSPVKRLQVEASVAGEVTNIKNTRNNGNGDYALVTELGSNANNTNNYHYIAATGGADRLYIYGNGNVVNTNNSYGTLSDISLKENIKDATPKLEDILKLKVRNFNLIGSEEKQIGFIAQELEEIFPKMVDVNGINKMKSIKTSVLVPMLVKAIQELKQEIDTLKN